MCVCVLPWQPSAESLSLVRLSSVSPFSPTARRNEAESERLKSVHDALHPDGGEMRRSKRREEEEREEEIGGER